MRIENVPRPARPKDWPPYLMFNTDVNHPVEVERLKGAGKIHRRQLRRADKALENIGPGLSGARACTSNRKFKKIAKTILSSKTCLQGAMYEADKKRSVRGRVGSRRLISKSYGYDVLRDLSEPVTVQSIPKSDGSGFRDIWDFGPVARGAQRMAADLLSMTYEKREFQYWKAGAGQKVQMAMSLIEQGYVYCGEIDIVKFYDSFECQALIDRVPLPKEAVTQILVASNAVPVPPSGAIGPIGSIAHPPTACPGIPQGSVASVEVAAWSVALMPEFDLGDVVLVNHIDNFYFFARDFKSLTAASKTLGSAIRGCPGGHFVGKVKQLCSFDRNGYGMLGCWISKIDGKVVADPMEKNVKILRWKFARKRSRTRARLFEARKAKNKLLRRWAVVEFVELEAYAKAWLAAFKFCRPITLGMIEAHLSYDINILRQKFQITDEEVKVARRFISDVRVDIY